MSLTKIDRQGMILFMMSFAVRNLEKLLSLLIAAVLTSLSVSDKKLVYYVSNLLYVSSSPK